MRPTSQNIPEVFHRIYEVTRQVRKGEVASYGQIAFVAQVPSARIVGQAMARLPARTTVPWHRIINSQGKLALRKDGGPSTEQRRRLMAEGVNFDGKGRVNFKEVAWPGPSWRWLESKGFDLDDLALRSQTLKRIGPWCRWRL